MVALNVIRRIETRATSSGVDETTAKLGALARAQTTVASTADGMAVSTESSARRQLSAAGAYDRLMRTVDDAFRSQQRFSAGQAVVERAFQQGIIDARQYTIDLQKVADKFGVVSLGAQRQAAEMERAAAAQARINAVTGVSSGSATASRGADVSAYGKQLDDLRAKYSPLYAAQRQYKETLDEINTAARVGAISEAERATAISGTKTAFAQQVVSLRGASSATAEMTEKTGLARHELINLGRQAQDVGTMLAMGASPMQVFTSQAAQIFDIFSSSKGSLGGFFSQMASGAAAFATSVVGAFTAVGAVVVGVIASLVSFRNEQEKIQLALMGVGRASGVTAQQLTDVGKAASSWTGLSTSEATEFATALAATGKVAQESLLPATQNAKSLAKVMGTDLAGAAQVMGQALSGNLDPINARLGAFSVALKDQVTLLMAQGREAQAQAIINRQVADATKVAAEATGGWSKAWTALGNAASEAWRAIGRGADQLTGNTSLEDQYKGAVAEIEKLIKKRDELQKQDRSSMSDEQRERINSVFRLPSGIASDEVNRRNIEVLNDLIAKGEANTKKLKDAMDAVKVSSDAVKANMQSIADQAVKASLLPEAAARQALAVQTASATAIASDPKRQAALGITQAEADEQKKRAESVESGFRSASQKIAEGYDIANKAITAFTPQQKASIAYLQTESQLRDNPHLTGDQKKQYAQEAYNIALKQEVVALSEQARARELYAKQSIASAQLELDMVGKTIAQQTEARANLQARQSIEQQLLQTHQKWGPAQDAELARLSELNKEYAKRAQLAAIKQAQSNADFTSQTQFMSQSDVAAAQVMRSLYNDEWQSHMDDALAKQIKMNVLIGEARDAGVGFAKDFVGGLMSGKSAMEALGSAATNLGNKLANSAIDDLLSGNFVSAGVKGAAAAVATWFGGQTESARKQEEARKEWEKTGPAFQLFLLQMSGGVQGDLSRKIQSAQQQFVDLSTKAEKAGDQAAIARMAQASISYQINQAKQFAATFDATVRGMSTGFGPDSPFLQAVNNVKSQLETALSFIDDVRTSNSTSGVLDMGAAINASFSFLTSLLGAAPKLSEVQTGLQKIEGTANALQGALEQLGVSSDAAAAAIRDGMARAIDDLRKTFTEGLTSRLNTATGKSYYNDAAALLVQYQQDMADAAALGIDAGLVSAVFRAEAQKIIEDAGLVGDAFTDFTRQFPALAGVVTESSDALAAAAKTQRDALNASAKSIVEYVNGLMTGSQAGLSPQDRFTAAQSAYNQKLALAQGGNADAMASIAQDFETYRSAAREMFGSTEQYQQILAAGINQLLTLPAVQQTTDPVVQAMRDVLLAVQAGNSTLVNVQTATQLNVAKTAEAAAQAQRTADLQASANSLTSTSNSLSYTANVLLDQQTAFLNSINNLQATAATQLVLLQTALAAAPGINYQVWNADVRGFVGASSNNNSMLTALSKIVVNTGATAFNTGAMVGAAGYQSLVTPQFADGGYHSGKGTGTSDSILAWVSNGEATIKAAAMDALGGRAAFDNLNAGRVPVLPLPVPVRAGNDNGDMRAVLDELRALKTKLAAIEGNTGRAVAVSAEGAQQIKQSVERGNDLQADTNKRLRRG